MSKIAIYAIIMCYSLTMAFAYETSAQRKYLSEISFELNYEGKRLIDLLEEIEGSSEFSFAYSKRELKDKSIYLTTGKWNMDDLLKEISVQARVSLRRINETITIKKVNEAEKLPVVSEVVYVKREISGRVIDENGEGLPGATIVEKGTTNGTITDIDGQFKIEVSEEASLLISFVGYHTQEVTVGDRTNFDITLEPDYTSLQEVVVIGYGEQRKQI